MREVSRGDLIFSFNNKKIMAIGVAEGPSYTCPKPLEFGATGAHWEEIGWRIDVNFMKLSQQIQPKDHMALLRQFLPERYSPIRPDGTGNQMYLAEISEGFAQALMALVGSEAQVVRETGQHYNAQRDSSTLIPNSKPDILIQWDEVQVEKVRHDRSLRDTERDQVIKSRRGQGLFRQRVTELEKWCRVTRVDQPEHLIASHIKPWSISNNAERLDGENGLFLTPSIDHLFGNGFISFKDSGDIIISPIGHRQSLIKMGIPTDRSINVGAFTLHQKRYLEYHRDSILLQARS